MTEHSDHDAQGAAGPVADWRAAWKAARGSANGATGSDATPAEETAGDTRPRQRWSPAPEPTWSAAAAAAATHGTGRTTTSTLEPQAPGNHRAPAVGGSGGAGHHDTSPTEPSPTEPSPTESSPADDMDESATETTGSLRAAFAQGLARAKALVEGRAEPTASGAAAGSLSPRVAAEIEATLIPPVTATSAVRAAVSAAAAAPAAVPATGAVPTQAAVGAPTLAPTPAVATGPTTGLTTGQAPASAAQRAAAPRRGTGRIRRAHLKVTRVDPWTVMKVSFMLSIAFGLMTVVAVAIVWSMLDAAGVFTSLNDTIASVTGGSDSESSFNLLKWVGFDRVIGVTTLIAVVDVVLITALATLGAFLYNLGSALIGGVEVTLVEDQR